MNKTFPMIQYNELKEVFKTFAEKGFTFNNEGFRFSWNYGKIDNPAMFSMSVKGTAVYIAFHEFHSINEYSSSSPTDYFSSYIAIDMTNKEMLYSIMDSAIKKYGDIMKSYKQRVVDARKHEIDKDFTNV